MVSVRTSLMVLVWALTASACVELGVVGDGTTVSWGPTNDGVLIDGRRLPMSGDGFVVPARWRARGSQWGTDELVGLITAVGHTIAIELPHARVAVADLSIAGGGISPYHRSHQTGRDADLLFFVRDVAGHPIEAVDMRHFDADGWTVDPGPRLRFDAARTWQLVRALLSADGPGIEHLFIYAPLRDQVLDYARASGEPESLIGWAGDVMSQPSDSAPHDDHLHVRVFCPVGDSVCVARA
jgi:penicillin-insensitive murein DD-endopeptidase